MHDVIHLADKMDAAGADADDWMLVEPKPASPVSYPSLGELRDASLGAPLPPIPAPAHPDPAVQHALAHLAAMGYGNEGGWLTQLVVMKRGDINAVLDVLSPARQ